MQFKGFEVLLGGGNYGRAAGTAGHEVDRGGSGLLGEYYQHALAHSFALVDEHDHAAVLQVLYYFFNGVEIEHCSVSHIAQVLEAELGLFAEQTLDITGNHIDFEVNRITGAPVAKRCVIKCMRNDCNRKGIAADLGHRQADAVEGHRAFGGDVAGECERWLDFEAMLPIALRVPTNAGYAIDVSQDEVTIEPIENYRARSLGGTMTAAFITEMDRPLRWVLLDIDFETGETRWPQKILYLDIGALSERLGRGVEPAVLVLDPAHPLAHPRLWRPTAMPASRHYGYAVQWWGLALALLILASILLLWLQLMLIDWDATLAGIRLEWLGLYRPEWLLAANLLACVTFTAVIGTRLLRCAGAATAAGLLALAIRYGLIQLFEADMLQYVAWIAALLPLLAIDIWSFYCGVIRMRSPEWRGTALVLIAAMALNAPVIRRLYQLEGGDNLAYGLAVIVTGIGMSWLSHRLADAMLRRVLVEADDLAESRAMPVKLSLGMAGGFAAFILLFIATASPPV